MKKIFALIFALMLVFSTAFSTTSMAISLTPIPSPLPLDSETEQQIIEDRGWADIPYEDITIKYYGTLSDGSMLIYTSKKGTMSTANIVENVIGDYLYVASSPAALIKVYKNNKFYNIKEAYETDVINDSVLDEIAQLFNFEHIGCTTELDSEVEYKIKDAYLFNLMINHNITTDIPLTDIKVHYYKTLSDESMLVLCESKYLEYSTDICEETIGNYIYSYSGNHIVLFKHNSLDEIKFAYDKNIIDDTVLDEIAQTLNFKSAISEETTATENTNPTETQNNSASSETKPASSNSNTSVNNTKNNGAIATGDNNTVMLISIFTVLTFATTVVLVKRKKS